MDDAAAVGGSRGAARPGASETRTAQLASLAEQADLRCPLAAMAAVLSAWVSANSSSGHAPELIARMAGHRKAVALQTR